MVALCSGVEVDVVAGRRLHVHLEQTKVCVCEGEVVLVG